MSGLPLWLEWVVAAMLVTGGVFALVGAIGMVRFRDFYMRLHAPTKATTLGVGGVLLASLAVSWWRGDFGVPGPGAIWYRVIRPMVEGASVSQAVRAVVAADFCNGTSAALDFREWTFLNADLTVSMAREPVGEWILLDAESTIGPDGAGLATARLADEKGYFGRAVQSLVIERR